MNVVRGCQRGASMTRQHYSFEPHFLQNLAAASFSAPQTGQVFLAAELTAGGGLLVLGGADGRVAGPDDSLAAAGVAESFALTVCDGGAVGVEAIAPL